MNFIALLDGQCHLLILCAFRMKFYVTLIMRFYLFRMLFVELFCLFARRLAFCGQAEKCFH